jgi:hypothetical protein
MPTPDTNRVPRVVRLAILILTLGAAPASAQGGAPAPSGPSLQTRVWVNLKSRVYHCPGDRLYGNTVDGEFMSEAAARGMGVRASRARGCTTRSSGRAPAPRNLHPSDRIVWVNTQSRVYHCPEPSDRFFGLTERGKYMLEGAAVSAGYRVASGKKCY